jgi:hypothetical protein
VSVGRAGWAAVLVRIVVVVLVVVVVAIQVVIARRGR